MNTIDLKIRNFQQFVRQLYINIGKELPGEVQQMTLQLPLEVLAMLKVSIKTLNITSADALYGTVKTNLQISNDDLSKLSATDIEKLKKYCNYFWEISLVI